jgi:16S rRNA (guanine527-N7)-methyltransferase
MKSKIKKLFLDYKIELEENEIKKFEKLLKIFIEKNSKINLSAIRDEKWIIVKHFIDSVFLNTFIEFLPGEKVADMWTGWGFPLLPLSIINSKTEFVWIDSVWKKLKAIEEFAKELELDNVSTIHTRAEELWKNEKYREQFDFVVSRATAYFPVLLEYSIPLLKVGWILCAYKLEDKQELKSIKKALWKLHCKILKVKNYEIEWQKRVIVFIEKQQKTPSKYPRKVGVPMIKPL